MWRNVSYEIYNDFSIDDEKLCLRINFIYGCAIILNRIHTVNLILIKKKLNRNSPNINKITINQFWKIKMNIFFFWFLFCFVSFSGINSNRILWRYYECQVSYTSITLKMLSVFALFMKKINKSVHMRVSVYVCCNIAYIFVVNISESF